MIVSFALHTLLGVGLIGFSVPLVRITVVVDSTYIDVVDDNEGDDTNFFDGAAEDDGDGVDEGRRCRNERGNDDD